MKAPIPPFSFDTATQKVRMAENIWNGRNPDIVVLAYSENTYWRNRDQFISGREQAHAFLTQKWTKEREYKLIKELWSYNNDVIAVRFAYEWHDDMQQWWRSYGNENWKFDAQGYMTHRYASINDVAILKEDRLFLWEGDNRPDDYSGLTKLGL